MGQVCVRQNRYSTACTWRRLTDNRALTVCPCIGFPILPHSGQDFLAERGCLKFCAGKSQTEFPASGGQEHDDSVTEILSFLRRLEFNIYIGFFANQMTDTGFTSYIVRGKGLAKFIQMTKFLLKALQFSDSLSDLICLLR